MKKFKQEFLSHSLISRIGLGFGILAFAVNVYAQNLQPGFDQLESGDFKQAEKFFSEILNEYPTNKTAQICFGRAQGLNGNPELALELFNLLLKEDSSDLEVQLNLAEAYLWNEIPDSALMMYNEVIKKDSTSFPAMLGLANSYSLSKRYERAHYWIQKSIITQPENQQAMISRKYIILGYANQLVSEKQQYDSAIALLNMNLKYNSNDQESLDLLASILMQSGQFTRAMSTFDQIEDSVNSLIGKSTLYHLINENDSALYLATRALEMAEVSSPVKLKKAELHYVSALIWNGELKQARTYLEDKQSSLVSNPDWIAMEADLAMYEADFMRGIMKYEEHLISNPSSFKGNLGRSNALHAMGMDKLAYKTAFNALEYYPGQKDVRQFISALNRTHAPKIEVFSKYMSSSDGSESTNKTVKGTISINPQLIGTIYRSSEEFSSSDRKDGIFSQSAGTTLSYQINPRLKLTGGLNVYSFDLNSDIKVNRTREQLSMDFWMSKHQKIKLSYHSDIQNFNQDLLNQNIKTSHIKMINSFYWKEKGWGWYSEWYLSKFSDNNSRMLVFNSAYKELIPSFKTGLNWLTMSFAKTLPTQYYSPERYNLIEIFGKYNPVFNNRIPLNLSVDLAAGYQMTKTSNDFSWRTSLTLSKEIDRWTLNGSALYSSVQTINSNGFSVQQFQLSIRYRLTDQPVFYKRIAPK